MIALLLKMVPDSNATNLPGVTDAAEPDHDSGRTIDEGRLVVRVDGGPLINCIYYLICKIIVV